MNTVSIWDDITQKSRTYPSLTGDIEVDVAIIGAGITGVTTALPLIKAGKKVAIIEALSVGGGTTAYSTGNLYVPVQPYYRMVKKAHGMDAVKKVAQSRSEAMDFIEATVREYGIECNFHRRPFYFFTDKNIQIPKLEREVKLLQKAGMDILPVENLPINAPYKYAALLENQARFNPLKYVRALASKLADMGCQIYEKTKVLDYNEHDDHSLVETEHGNIKAGKLVVATHIPKGFNIIQTLTAPYRSYVVAVKLRGAYPNGNFWDLTKPHHAISTHSIGGPELDILCIAGSHHKTGQGDPEDHYRELEDYARKHFDVESVAYRWSAQHYKSGDSLPYIGLSTRFSKHTYMSTSYYADGLTYGTVAGLLLADLVQGKENQYAEVFDSMRFKPLTSAPVFVKENVNVAAQLIKDIPVEAKHFSDIAPGEGKTINVDGDKCAAYRDENNKLHVCSAICPHLYCTVHWNSAEKSWDCPCHGSRFTYEGRVIEGPAFSDLAKKEVRE
jgi:glycine/D-amino acid oxidase-like deaminating enzyme/nitrite reductase/ring-hydroxylating ferredoxin subunit